MSYGIPWTPDQSRLVEVVFGAWTDHLAKRRSYPSATAFYNDFENGKWLTTLVPPVNMESSSFRKVLTQRWLADADFTRSWDHSNVVLMQLELVAAELTPADIEQLLDLPTRDSRGKDQSAGILPFLEFIRQKHPGMISPKWRAGSPQTRATS